MWNDRKQHEICIIADFSTNLKLKIKCSTNLANAIPQITWMHMLQVQSHLTKKKKKKNFRARRGGAGVKVLALHAQDPTWVLVLSRRPHFPSSSLPVAWESSRGWPKALGTCTRVGDPQEAPGFGSAQYRPGALTWGVNHRTEDLPLCLSSLYIRLSNKK